MNPITQVSALVSPPVSTGRSDSGNIVNKEEFLQLLVAQLQRQDPLNPQDPAEFTSQLAQFSSLEQLINVNSSIASLANMQGMTAMVSAANFIGQNATVVGDALTVSEGKPSRVEFQMARDSVSTHMNVYDSSGALVAVVDLGARAAGENGFDWDGRLANGESLRDGNYRFEITAMDANNLLIDVLPMFEGRVDGISFDRGQVLLEINGRRIPMSELIRVGAAAAQPSSN
ncbi:MAG TPA: flagellar hook capping FlgD N-terminal domain-containing protein [Candidatus Sumerlaeota bacterium]|nr:flagellar hook capping FlgD N-terminal domain-containing protein [Candidatus Sumerlaeota bacterium]HOR26844.1 flagellar hook capping FlgD N-terminal domain-containing protein [Candidatus Sumerlaeota bacterium]HPK01393.1 flagellar hook capping FlgD N-terminal domain-containing protein [Candidatus Sumerlaeota bacterium]